MQANHRYFDFWKQNKTHTMTLLKYIYNFNVVIIQNEPINFVVIVQYSKGYVDMRLLKYHWWNDKSGTHFCGKKEVNVS